MNLQMESVINPPNITIVPLAKSGDRDDFLVRVTDDHNNHEFRLSLTGTIVAIWNIEPTEAAKYLVDRLVYSHGTAGSFAEEGFWFDSNNSSPDFEQTVHDIENKGSSAFDHPSIKTELGSKLFTALDKLDGFRASIDEKPFVRSLDVLFERSQAGDDFESEAKDHAHFIYRVCIASAIIDRFNFTSATGSLNGLKEWLNERLSDESANELTKPFFMIKKLRKQYPIHEEFEVSGSGVRARRTELEQAESFFGLRHDAPSDWHAVRTKFVTALESLLDALENH